MVGGGCCPSAALRVVGSAKRKGSWAKASGNFHHLPPSLNLRPLAVQCYAPYTKSHSGAAIITRAGKVYSGGFIESAAFNPSLTPFHTAWISAVTEHTPGFEEVGWACTVVLIMACMCLNYALRLVKPLMIPVMNKGQQSPALYQSFIKLISALPFFLQIAEVVLAEVPSSPVLHEEGIRALLKRLAPAAQVTALGLQRNHA